MATALKAQRHPDPTTKEKRPPEAGVFGSV